MGSSQSLGPGRPTLSPAQRSPSRGHTDSVGSDAYNQGLSERRAQSVRQYLVDKGLSPSMVVATGAGESSPVDSNDTAEGRSKNRRVVIKATR